MEFFLTVTIFFLFHYYLPHEGYLVAGICLSICLLAK